MYSRNNENKFYMNFTHSIINWCIDVCHLHCFYISILTVIKAWHSFILLKQPPIKPISILKYYRYLLCFKYKFSFTECKLSNTIGFVKNRKLFFSIQNT